jgi:hypothetical protein
MGERYVAKETDSVSHQWSVLDSWHKTVTGVTGVVVYMNMSKWDAERLARQLNAYEREINELRGLTLPVYAI